MTIADILTTVIVSIVSGGVAGAAATFLHGAIEIRKMKRAKEIAASEITNGAGERP